MKKGLLSGLVGLAQALTPPPFVDEPFHKGTSYGYSQCFSKPKREKRKQRIAKKSRQMNYRKAKTWKK